MVAIPLAATLFTAMIRWQRNREVRPTVESACLNTGLNLYGTIKINGSSNSNINSGSSEENGNGKYFFLLCSPRFLHKYAYRMMHHELVSS